jgi:hypothetical protein
MSPVGILSAIADAAKQAAAKVKKWAKETFGTTKPNPNAYRKATAEEKARSKLANVKGPVYVKAEAKRVTKTSTVLPQRAIRRARQGGLSNEAYAKARGPKITPFKDGGYRASFKMPTTRKAFEKRLREITKKYGRVPAHLAVEYEGGNGASDILRMAPDITWGNLVALDMAYGNAGGSGKNTRRPSLFDLDEDEEEEDEGWEPTDGATFYINLRMT